MIKNIHSFKIFVRNQIIITIFLLLLSNSVFSQLILSGTQTVCETEAEVYEIQGATLGTVYSWNITPAIGSINLISNTQAVIQWNTAGSCTITVSGGGQSSNPLTVIVYKTNKPIILFDNEVGCQKISSEDTMSYNEIIEDSIINVCEYLEVEYKCQPTIISGLNLSQFTWTVAGGKIIGIDGVTQNPPSTIAVSGTLFDPNDPYSRMVVKWDSAGLGTITVTELTPYASQNYSNPTNCGPKTTTMNITIIKSPDADFLVDNQHFTSQNDCYNICLNQTVNFQDLSTANPRSPILFWYWDFGDGTAVSHQQNPSHKYTKAGNYDVMLRVTNRCNCTSEYSIYICVDDRPAPNIECPSVLCENEKAKYTIDANCASYNWTISGGTKLSQNDPEIEIKWDNIDTTGFGYLSFDGSNCDEVCAALTTIRIPVLLLNGTIKGPKTVCANQIYKYELPTWPATNFEWFLVNNSNGAKFSTLQMRDNFAEIQMADTSGSFDLECRYYNTITKSACVGYASIHVDVQDQPDIEISKKSCINLAQACSLMVDGGILFNLSGQVLWTVLKPDGTLRNYTSSSNPVLLPDTIFNLQGTYRILATSLNGSFCDPKHEEIKIIDTPPKPMGVYGEDHICIHYPYSYSTNIIDNTLMHWSLTGANAPATSTAHTRTSTWNTGGAKSITLYREWEEIPGCISDTFVKVIHNINLTGIIVGNDTTYEDMVGTYTMALTGVVADAYEWSISPATAGNISAGQGTNSCTITWLHQTSPMMASINCRVTKCGTKVTFQKNVYIDKSAEITSFTVVPNTVCSGDSVVFTVLSTGAAVSGYIWDFGDGLTQTITPSIPNNLATISHIYHNISNAGLIYTAKVKVISSNTGLVTSTANVSISINPQPNSYLSPGNPTSVPPDTLPMILSVSTTNGNSNTYQWFYIEEGTSTTTTLNSTTDTNTITSTPPFNGDYWCIVTNSYGCITETNHKILGEGGNSQSGCTPLSPAGIDSFPSFITSAMPCGQVQINCTTLGDTTSNGNILAWNWGVSPSGTQYITSGQGTINQSPIYTFAKAGMYKIMLQVQYVNNIAGNPPCSRSKGGYVIVPMVSDFIWGFGCLGPNYNTYQLLLYDYSSLYPSYTTQTRKWEILDSNLNVLTTIYANNIQDTLFTVPSNLLGKQIFVKLSITNNLQIGDTCTKMHSIIIPNLPVADFSVQTTYTGNPSNPYKSCENREIAFINNSTGDIHTHIWNFGFGSPIHTSHMVNTFEVYDYTTLLPYTPKLTITDKYGCKDDTSVQIQVFDNTLERVQYSPEYTPLSTESCPGMNLNDTIIPIYQGGAAPYSYQWYQQSDTLANAIAPNLTYAYAGTGAYWVQISDIHNCYLNLNPTPVLVSVKDAPTAIINGKTDICFGEPLSLTVNTGMAASAPLSYLWLPSLKITKKIFPAIPSANTYSDSVIVTDNSIGGCTAKSSPFNFIVHPQPAQPTILGPTVINCENYKLELQVASPISSNTYTWSTGLNGTLTHVFNGGVYRLWTRDTFNCESHNDIAIQYPPDWYFWRFPTGCYSFCPDELPKQVWPSTWTYGVSSIMFSDWAWIHDGVYISNSTNGPPVFSSCNFGFSPIAPSYSIPCRLWLDNINQSPPPIPASQYKGEGAGDYSWMLYNDLCKQESDILNLSIKECCELDLRIEELRCIQSSPTGNTYHFTITVDGVPCPTQYNLSGENDIPFSNPNAITITSLSPDSLDPGFNILMGTFKAQPWSNTVFFKINILCEDCYGESFVDSLPPCNGPRMAFINDSLPDMSLTDLSKLNVYPNPANDNITISYNFAEDKYSISPIYSINIFDITGILIRTMGVNNISGEYKLDVSKFSSGVYFVALIQNNVRIKTKRFIINH